ncbi:methyltransferase domain-containing protein [Litoribacter ruber]|uniref:Methyltransferase domain-containing protein n=1 Tax=Litoribacter ruber TaxID=702568 RepID=A0AAP2CMM9_9BACT|nr:MULTISPECIES: methyltransferase domain-containing protein [Litoribacter]MBS9524622.1 methyltransferase domain-containing protein [Litoribacter alkaliphilus]MBT0810220.1 methyltransferase domain-containing protein [Litoribacter ruber]
MDKSLLHKELFSNIKTTGAITFSSKALVSKMLSYAELKGAKTIVELGGGDGSITRGIVEKMDKDADLYVFEISQKFCDSLKKEFPQNNIHIICDSASNFDNHINGSKPDVIFSSLPFSLIPKEEREKIYSVSSQKLNGQGPFIQICYSYLLKFQFAKHFSKVKASWTLKNFPPAFIMVCN